MFAKLIKSSVPINFIFLPIIIFAGWWLYFVGMDTLLWSSDKSILLPLLPDQVFSQPWCGIIPVVFSIFTALLMIPFTIKYFHNTSGNLLPVVIFLALIAPSHWLFGTGPVCISSFFCMLAFRYIFETYHQKRIFHYGFMAGFLSSLATLIYLPSILFIVICWTGLILLRSFKLREILIVLIGFLIPLIFTHAIFMILSREKQLINLIKDTFINTPFLNFEIRKIIWMSFLGILCLWGVIKSITSDSLKKILLRRYFETLAIALGIFILAFFSLLADSGLFTLIVLPLSFILAIALSSIRKTIYASIFIFILILLQIAAQISFII